MVAQIYQAILERRPAQIITRLKEILAKPDPTLGFYNGELRFWLGWAQEVAGDHAAAQESWQQALTELESFLQEQPDNYALIGDLALTKMGLGDKPAALALAERAVAANPIEKDALEVGFPMEILARVAARMGEPDRAIAALQKLLSIPYAGPVCKTYRLLRRCSGWIRCLIRSGMIRAFKSSSLARIEVISFVASPTGAYCRAIVPSRSQVAQSAIVSIRIVSRSGFTPNSFTQRPSHRCSSRRRYWVHRCSSSRRCSAHR